jgi:hypothetical protein
VAAAISASVLPPSEKSVWQCRRPRRSESVTSAGELDFPATFPQLGRHIGEAERGVDILLLDAANEPLAAIEARLLQAKASFLGHSLQGPDMRGRAGGENQGGAIAAPAREPEPNLAVQLDHPRRFSRGALGHERKVGDQFTPAPALPGRHDAFQLGVRPLEVRGRAGQDLGRLVDEALPLRAAHQLDAAQDLVLEGSPEAFCGLQPAVAAGLLEIRKARHVELAIELKHLLRREPGDLQHFEDPGRSLAAHRLELGRRAVRVELLDGFGDRLADAGHLAQPTRRDDLLERERQGHEALRGSRIGARLVRVLARQDQPAADLDEQLRNRGSIKAHACQTLAPGIRCDRASTPAPLRPGLTSSAPSCPRPSSRARHPARFRPS